MSIFNELKVQITGEKRYNTLKRPPVISFEVHEVQKNIDIENPTTTFEYVLRGTLQVYFWCNNAQYLAAKKNAEKVLANVLYSDVLDGLDNIEANVYAGDADQILTIINKIRKELLP